MRNFPREELILHAKRKVPFFISSLHALRHPEFHQEWYAELDGVGKVEYFEAEIADSKTGPKRKAELVGEQFRAIGKAVMILSPERPVPALHDFCVEYLPLNDFKYLSELQSSPLDVIGLMPPASVVGSMIRELQGNRVVSRALENYITKTGIETG